MAWDEVTSAHCPFLPPRTIHADCALHELGEREVVKQPAPGGAPPSWLQFVQMIKKELDPDPPRSQEVVGGPERGGRGFQVHHLQDAGFDSQSAHPASWRRTPSDTVTPTSASNCRASCSRCCGPCSGGVGAAPGRGVQPLCLHHLSPQVADTAGHLETQLL